MGNTDLKIKDMSVLNLTRIEHTRLTLGYLMTNEEAPYCKVCGIRLTVKHIVTECMKYEQDRHKFKMEEILDIALGPETANNVNVTIFKKNLNVQQNLKKIMNV